MKNEKAGKIGNMSARPGYWANKDCKAGEIGQIRSARPRRLGK